MPVTEGMDIGTSHRISWKLSDKIKIGLSHRMGFVGSDVGGGVGGGRVLALPTEIYSLSISSPDLPGYLMGSQSNYPWAVLAESTATRGREVQHPTVSGPRDTECRPEVRSISRAQH